LAAEVHFIDVNVPMYAAGGPHPLRTPCIDVLQAVVQGDIEAVTDAEAHQEIYYRYMSLRRLDLAKAVSDRFMTIVPTILPIGKAEIRLLADLADAYPALQARDLIHLAAMRTQGLTRIITTDTGFATVPDIIRIAPGQAG
jgi:predicted nucleic acid-binding protein